jgi:hypothetical protein
MPRVFRQQYTRPIPPEAERVTFERKGKKVPGVRFRGPDGKTVTAPLTKNGDRCRLASPTWYGRVNGRPVPLCTNKVAAEQARRAAARRPRCSSASPPRAGGWASSRGRTCQTC